MPYSMNNIGKGSFGIRGLEGRQGTESLCAVVIAQLAAFLHHSTAAQLQQQLKKEHGEPVVTVVFWQ